MFNGIGKYFMSLENKFVLRLSNIKDVKINSNESSGKILNGLKMLLKSPEYREIIERRKLENERNYDFFKYVFFEIDCICRNCLNYYVKKYPTPIGIAKSNLQNIVVEFEKIFNLLDFKKVNLKLKFSEVKIKYFREKVFADISMYISNIISDLDEYLKKSSGENIFIEKKSNILKNKIIYLKKLFDESEEEFNLDDVKYFVKSIISLNYSGIEEVNYNIKEFKSYFESKSILDWKKYIDEVEQVYNNSLDFEFEEKLNEVFMTIVKLIVLNEKL